MVKHLFCMHCFRGGSLRGWEDRTTAYLVGQRPSCVLQEGFSSCWDDEDWVHQIQVLEGFHLQMDWGLWFLLRGEGARVNALLEAHFIFHLYYQQVKGESSFQLILRRQGTVSELLLAQCAQECHCLVGPLWETFSVLPLLATDWLVGLELVPPCLHLVL